MAVSSEKESDSPCIQHIPSISTSYFFVLRYFILSLTYNTKGWYNCPVSPLLEGDNHNVFKSVADHVYLIIKNNITTAMICEGPFDVLTCYTYGYPAIGTFGNPSPYQIAAINRSPIKVLYLAMDNDSAGRRMANTIKAGFNI